MGGGKGLAHLVQRGLGHGADDFCGVGVVYRDDTVAAALGADLAPDQAHAVEVVVKDELLDHEGLSLKGQGRGRGRWPVSLGVVQGKVKGIKIPETAAGV